MITITLHDLPDGRVFVHSTHRPAVGAAATPAQCLAMDILTAAPRTYPVYTGDAASMRPELRAMYDARLQSAAPQKEASHG